MPRKTAFFLLLLINVPIILNAQSSSELRVKNSFFSGIKFEYIGNDLSIDEALLIVKPNEEAETFLRKSKSQATASGIVGAVGSALIGLPLGTAIGGGDPNWNFLYFGAGIVVLSFPIYNSAVKNARNGARVYNDAIADKNIATQLSFSVNASVASLKLSF